MVDVSVESDRAVFNVEGLHKLWSFRSRLEIPLEHITGVEVNPDQARRWWHGIKLLGTDGGPVFTAGLFYCHGEMVFWDVNDPAKSIIVSLADETYKRLIIEVADPASVATKLMAAMAR